MSKTPNQSRGYYAVRKGEAGRIRNCIFLNWDDAQDIVTANTAEYRVFDSFQEAEHYLRSAPTSTSPARPKKKARMSTPLKTTKAPAGGIKAMAQTLALARGEQTQARKPTTPKKKTKKAAPSPSPALTKKKTVPKAASKDASMAVPVEQDDAELLASIATVVEKGDATLTSVIKDATAKSPTKKPTPSSKKQTSSKKRSRKDDDNDSQQVLKTKETTKSWEENFARYKEMVEKNTFEMDDDKLDRWAHEQRRQYRLLQQNKPTTMTTDKIGRLSLIGFEFDRKAAAEVQNELDDAPSKPPRKISKRWLESLAKLKDYMDSHDGSWEVDKYDAEHAKLRKWVTEQDTEYRKLKQGLESRINEEKVEILKGIGVEFNHMSWEERIAQLLAYKAVHGNLDIPNDHPELGQWCQYIERQWTRVLEDGKVSHELSAARMEQLKQLGFDPLDDKWQEGFAKMEAFKRENGHCRVVKNKETLELYKWAANQRQNYKKLLEGLPCQLTADRLARLTALGFDFGNRSRYRSWNDRIEDLREFKKEHGHLNIPVNHPELGDFASRQRMDLKKRLVDGDTSALSDERFEILKDLGFELTADAWKEKPPRKTWDERYLELIAFKEEFGHAIVPQHSDYIEGLGRWVQGQRKYWKWIQQGKKSPLTPERMRKLSKIGFAFSVEGSGRRSTLEDSSVHI